MHLGASPSSLVQVRTVTRRITTSGNSDNIRGRSSKKRNPVSNRYIIRECHLFSPCRRQFSVFFCFLVEVIQIGLNLFVSSYVCLRLACRLMLACSTIDDVLSCKWLTKNKEFQQNKKKENFSIYQTSLNTVSLPCYIYISVYTYPTRYKTRLGHNKKSFLCTTRPRQ